MDETLPSIFNGMCQILPPFEMIQIEATIEITLTKNCTMCNTNYPSNSITGLLRCPTIAFSCNLSIVGGNDYVPKYECACMPTITGNYKNSMDILEVSILILF
jgi:hypothetical protein